MLKPKGEFLFLNFDKREDVSIKKRINLAPINRQSTYQEKQSSVVNKLLIVNKDEHEGMKECLN